MLPDNLYNSYLEYKKDTKTYITWLCETAVSSSFTPQYTSPRGSRSKNKPRSEQREISSSGLILCAEAILKKPPRQFAVPLYASESAVRAIRLNPRYGMPNRPTTLMRPNKTSSYRAMMFMRRLQVPCSVLWIYCGRSYRNRVPNHRMAKLGKQHPWKK
jgi:hypothetical protein